MADQKLALRKRKPHAKSRTGCFTCKARRVKCDETRPECLRCVRGGRTCEFPEQQDIVVQRNAELPSSLSLRIFDTQRECGYFDFFRFQTVIDLSGWFNSYFWQRLVLQMAHSEGVVRRAAVALGALHVDGRTEYALQYYGEALTGLRGLLAKSDFQSIDASLTACLLLTCFEVLRKDYEAAKLHYACGLKILKLWRSSQPQGPERCTQHPQSIPCYEKSLVEHFTLLETQIISFLQSRPNNLLDPVLFEDSVAKIPIPLEFATLNEAKETFAQLLNTSLNLAARATNQLAFAQAESKPNKQGIYPHRETYDASVRHGNVLRTVITEFLLGITQWRQAFDSFLGISSSTMTTQQRRATYVLKSLSTVVYILFARDPTKGEMGFDAFQPQFEEATAEALTAVRLHGTRQSARPPIFALNLGVLHTLWSIAVKCRHKHTREQVLHAISCAPYREGIWDGATGTVITRAIIDLEESHRIPGTVGPEGITAEWRIIAMNFRFDAAEGKVLLFVDRPGRREEHCVELGQWDAVIGRP
ncbi:hypothetical protein BDV25DRAFT_168531 [Aspergillus avenaceus]|uniref:Zn(2)-C6 fungal-type domain-containing protein n=1 Tax=Aspergillus avenaceus TaxID=36643 RepID=A0A5N6TPR5_ASPAV|nr:hypothetical protein BDV25DRAFT_168531 [Aspergillus avenaceus]